MISLVGIGGFTQNSNESFNATVWSMAPKSVLSGKVILDIVATIAVCVYNDGLSSIMKIMEVLGMTIGPTATISARRLTRAASSFRNFR